jgi:hypothetical protein
MNGFSASHGLVFFLSLLWNLTFGHACIHIRYIRVLYPWDWISIFCGLVFFFVLVDLNF